MIIQVRHNIEVAHRLWQLEGNKCQNIHGHSMWVTLELTASHVDKGIAVNEIGDPLEFGLIKKHFREYLDSNFDHHLLLNQGDPWAQPLQNVDLNGIAEAELPGLVKFEGDPSTENIALEIKKWAGNKFYAEARVHVQETHVNGVIA